MIRTDCVNNLSHWDSYWVALWEALEATTGDVIELGMGHGSTQKLHDYCLSEGRNLYSYESNLGWFQKFEHLTGPHHRLVCVHDNWQVMLEEERKRNDHIGVLFSDEAVGEMRKYNISMFCNLAEIVIAHDFEESSDGGYKFSLVKPLFKYVKLHSFPGASTGAMSNFIDVSKWVL